MKRTFGVIGLICLLLITALVPLTSSLSVQSVESQNQAGLPVTELSSDTITLADVHNILKGRLAQIPVSIQLKHLLAKAIEQGIAQLNTNGLSSEQNLLKMNAEDIGNLAMPRFRLPHVFLINYYPDVVNMSLTLDPWKMEMSNSSGYENRTLEIFVKLVPIVDYVKTEQRIIFRKLYQNTAYLFPSIGCRILQDNSTLFIIAFGPMMQRNWKLF